MTTKKITVAETRLHKAIEIIEGMTSTLASQCRVQKEGNVVRYGVMSYNAKLNCVIISNAICDFDKAVKEQAAKYIAEIKPNADESYGQKRDVIYLKTDFERGLTIIASLCIMAEEARHSQLYFPTLDQNVPQKHLRDYVIKLYLERDTTLSVEEHGVYVDPDNTAPEGITNIVMATGVEVEEAPRGTFIWFPKKFQDFYRFAYLMSYEKEFRRPSMWAQIHIAGLIPLMTNAAVYALTTFSDSFGGLNYDELTRSFMRRGLQMGYRTLHVCDYLNRHYDPSIAEPLVAMFNVERKGYDQFNVTIAVDAIKALTQEEMRTLVRVIVNVRNRTTSRIPVVCKVPSKHKVAQFLTPEHQGILAQGYDGESYSLCIPFWEGALQAAEVFGVKEDDINTTGVHYVLDNIIPHDSL